MSTMFSLHFILIL